MIDRIFFVVIGVVIVCAFVVGVITGAQLERDRVYRQCFESNPQQPYILLQQVCRSLVE